jgi:hypothetical protein
MGIVDHQRIRGGDGLPACTNVDASICNEYVLTRTSLTLLTNEKQRQAHERDLRYRESLTRDGIVEVLSVEIVGRAEVDEYKVFKGRWLRSRGTKF